MDKMLKDCPKTKSDLIPIFFANEPPRNDASIAPANIGMNNDPYCSALYAKPAGEQIKFAAAGIVVNPTPWRRPRRKNTNATMTKILFLCIALQCNKKLEYIGIGE
jgi:hypothetical protein